MQCQVLVVGAGPGGAAAAYWLARAGADVLLVDRTHFPRDKPCGDGLTPRAVKHLASMGLGDFVHIHGKVFTGLRLFLQDSFTPNYALGGEKPLPHGCIIPRRLLDDALRQQAIAAGARFLSGVTALAPYYQRGQGMGMQGVCQNQLLTITARLTIIATGANRTLAQALGLCKAEQPKALALRAYMAGLTDLDEHLEIYLDRETLPGYGWLFPTAAGTANVGMGITWDGLTTAAASQRLRAAFDRLLQQRRFRDGKLLCAPRGYPLCTDFPAIPLCTAGVLLVGETAGLVDPLIGEGIGLALESGKAAADVAMAALAADDVSERRLRAYSDTLREKYAGYFQEARELLARVDHPQVLAAFLDHARADHRVGDALQMAIVNGRPRDSIATLNQVLSAARDSPAQPLFILNAYRPLLCRCRDYMLAQVALDTPSPMVSQLLARGKMVRALLVFLGCQAAGGDPVQVLAGAAGIELVHAASLIHDDIMDGATTRRGLPALHTTLGDARAIVCGDYLIAKAFRLLAESRTQNPAAHVVEAFIIGAESGIRACAGQFQDVGTWTEATLTEEMYNQLIADKTAAAIAGALRAGAALAGGDASLLESLTRYGECVGRAFQIKDDLLDLVNIANNGCCIDRKPSLPLIHAFQHSDRRGRKIIQHFLDRQDVSGDELDNVLRATGALAFAESAAHAFAGQAVQLASAVPQIRQVLEAFARYVVLRAS